MNTEKILQTPLFQMTGEQFVRLLKEAIHRNEGFYDNIENSASPNEKKYVYGIRGIANLLDCSISTANRIKKKGTLDGAIIQQGRTIMVDVDKALELLKKSSKL